MMHSGLKGPKGTKMTHIKSRQHFVALGCVGMLLLCAILYSSSLADMNTSLSTFSSSRSQTLVQGQSKYPAENVSTLLLETNLAQPRIRTKLIVYNVVPKCASTFVRSILEKVAEGRFMFTRSGTTKIYPFLPLNLMHLVKDGHRPVMFATHYQFVDFGRFGYPNPPHIQLMRDPVSQAMSYYNFQRDRNIVTNDEWNKTVDECLDRPALCFQFWFVLNRTNLHHFCENCSVQDSNGVYVAMNTRAVNTGVVNTGAVNTGVVNTGAVNTGVVNTGAANTGVVNKAIQNIIKYHTVVGVTEDLGGFFQLLEYVHPDFFRGITTMYRERISEKEKKHRNVSKAHKEWSTRALEVFRAYRKEEIQVYKFLKQRFYRHLKLLNQTKEASSLRV